MFNLSSRSHVSRAGASDTQGDHSVSTVRWDVTSLRYADHTDKHDGKTAQTRLQGRVRVLTNYQSFQGCVLKFLGGLTAL